MIKMSQININEGSVSFDGIEFVQKGVTIYLEAGNTSVYLVSKTSTKIENWLSLIVATFNVKEDRDSNATLNNKTITFDNVEEIEMDLGFSDA